MNYYYLFMRMEVNASLMRHRDTSLLYSYSGGTAKAGMNQAVVIALAQWHARRL